MISVLCREVDRKREELRVMVGERYRDLIEAADTIHQMRSCTRSVMASLTEMQEACSSLGRVESAVEGGEWSEARLATSAHLGVAASVKLLTLLPEQIWAAGEAGQWSSAAQLYLLAQHLHTGLQADHGSGLSPHRICQWYPVINRQWDVLQQLYSSLLNSCHSQLAARDLTGERALDSLLAVMLLTSSSQTDGLRRTLELRLAGLKSLVSSCRTESAVTGLSSLARGVQATVVSLETCLVSGGLASKLNCVASAQQPTISVIPAHILGPTAKYLPQPIQQFKPKISDRQLASIEENVLSESMRSWLDRVVEESRGEIRAMLQFVSSVESLKRVEEAVLEVLGQERLAWAGGVSVWDLIFRSLISDRMQEIVTSQLEGMMETAGREVESLLAEEEERQLEFVWSENPGEIGEVWGAGKMEKAGLRMKCWGWSGKLQDIASRLDSALERLRHSLESQPEILSHCSLVCSGCLLSLLAEICEEGRGQPVLRSRVCQALLRLTTSLPGLLAQRAVQLNLQLEEKQRLLLAGWSSSLLSSLSSSLLRLTPNSSLASLPAWDELNIAESGDSGEEVTSLINVPASPSLPLLSALLQLSSEIHSQHPTSLPPAFLTNTTSGAVTSILAHYAQLAANTLTQNFALQLLFDVHFIETMLVSRENKEAVSPTIKQIISSLEANIDPFDLSVFSPHTEERVRLCCSRLVWGLACLVPADRLPVISSYKNLHSDNPNILTISTQSCPRFQLLALAPLPKAEDRGQDRGQVRGQALTASSHPAASSLASKSARTDRNNTGAATFFGSMSWFGNN